MFQVIQRRVNGRENFRRSWSEYANGFGSPDGEFWIGQPTVLCHRFLKHSSTGQSSNHATFQTDRPETSVFGQKIHIFIIRDSPWGQRQKALVEPMLLYCTVLYCKLWTQAIASKSTSKFSHVFYTTNRLTPHLTCNAAIYRFRDNRGQNFGLFGTHYYHTKFHAGRRHARTDTWNYSRLNITQINRIAFRLSIVTLKAIA